MSEYPRRLFSRSRGLVGLALVGLGLADLVTPLWQQIFVGGAPARAPLDGAASTCALPGEIPERDPEALPSAFVVTFDLSGLAGRCWERGRDPAAIEGVIRDALAHLDPSVAPADGDWLFVASSGLEGADCFDGTAGDRCTFRELVVVHGDPIPLTDGAPAPGALGAALAEAKRDWPGFRLDDYAFGGLPLVEPFALYAVAERWAERGAAVGGEGGFRRVVVAQLDDQIFNRGRRLTADLVKTRSHQLAGRVDVAPEWALGRLDGLEQALLGQARSALPQEAKAYACPGAGEYWLDVQARIYQPRQDEVPDPAIWSQSVEPAGGATPRHFGTLAPPDGVQLYRVDGGDWRSLDGPADACVEADDPPEDLAFGWRVSQALPETDPERPLFEGLTRAATRIETVPLCDGCDLAALTARYGPIRDAASMRQILAVEAWRAREDPRRAIPLGVGLLGLLLALWALLEPLRPPMRLVWRPREGARYKAGPAQDHPVLLGEVALDWGPGASRAYWERVRALRIRPAPLEGFRLLLGGPEGARLSAGEGAGSSWGIGTVLPIHLNAGRLELSESSPGPDGLLQLQVPFTAALEGPEVIPASLEGDAALTIEAARDAQIEVEAAGWPAAPVEHRQGEAPAQPHVTLRLRAVSESILAAPWAGVISVYLTPAGDEALSAPRVRVIGADGPANLLSVRDLAPGRAREVGIELDFDRIAPPPTERVERYALEVFQIRDGGQQRCLRRRLDVTSDTRIARLALSLQVGEAQRAEHFPEARADNVLRFDVKTRLRFEPHTPADQRQPVHFLTLSVRRTSHGAPVRFEVVGADATFGPHPEETGPSADWGGAVHVEGRPLDLIRYSAPGERHHQPARRWSGDLLADAAEARFDLKLDLSSIRDLPRHTQRAVLDLPFRYRDEETGEQWGVGRLRIGVTLVRATGPRVLALDIGTSAICAAAICDEGDREDLEWVSREALLYLDRVVLGRLRQRYRRGDDDVVENLWRKQPEGGLPLDTPRPFVWSAVTRSGGPETLRWPTYLVRDISDVDTPPVVIPYPKNLFYTLGQPLGHDLQAAPMLQVMVSQVLGVVRESLDQHGDPSDPGDVVDWLDKGRVLLTHPNTFGGEEINAFAALVQAELPAADVHFLSESDAVAWYAMWRSDADFSPGQRLLIYDAGAGTLDLSYLEIRADGGELRFRLLFRAGVPFCGNALTEAMARALDDRLRALENLGVGTYPFPLVGPEPDADRRDLYRERVPRIWRDIEDMKRHLRPADLQETEGSLDLLELSADGRRSVFQFEDDPQKLRAHGVALNQRARTYTISISREALQRRLNPLLHALTDELLERFESAVEQIQVDGGFQVDHLIFSGRTSLFAGLRDRVREGVRVRRRDAEAPLLVHDLAREATSAKAAVALGATRYALRILGDEPRIPPLHGGFGALWRERGGWRYLELLRIRPEQEPLRTPGRVDLRPVTAGPWLVWDYLLALRAMTEAGGRSPRADLDYRRERYLGGWRNDPAVAWLACDVELMAGGQRIDLSVSPQDREGRRTISQPGDMRPVEGQDPLAQQWPFRPVVLPEETD